jgi:hypothetical protein
LDLLGIFFVAKRLCYGPERKRCPSPFFIRSAHLRRMRPFDIVGRTPPVDRAQLLGRNALRSGAFPRSRFQSCYEAVVAFPPWGRFRLHVELLSVGGKHDAP